MRLMACEARATALAEAIDLLPCLNKARAGLDGKGVVMVPEWVIGEIAVVLAANQPQAEPPAPS